MQKFDKVALLILDGWGLGQETSADAIAQAHTPYMDHLMKTYPNTTLTTFGEAVGLPEGQMGNSEVGHLNIGAGRVVYQELARINKAVRTKELAENKTLAQAISAAQNSTNTIHLMGLLSDGGVHSHIKHLLALCDILQDKVAHIYIHAFTDGRDTDPKMGTTYLSELLQHIKAMPNVKLASIVGRYFAMDRDKRWERVKEAYDLLIQGKGLATEKPIEELANHYRKDITDEFMPPIKVGNIGVICPNDTVICFNFRTDRCREITEVLTQQDMPDFGMHTLPLHYYTMTRYDEKFKNIGVLFEKGDITETLGEVLEKHHKKQVRIAETEKYPHVTFFFSGGREQPFEGEDRIIIPSPKVATYDLQPEMSAFEITNAIRTKIAQEEVHFICLNYANADMVGHTGDFNAAKIAATTVDNCLSNLVPDLLAQNYAIIVIADHGNSDFMINPDGSPNTAHTTNPVPCILVTPNAENIPLQAGKLGDIAPTILDLMQIEKPKVMDGESLILA